MNEREKSDNVTALTTFSSSSNQLSRKNNSHPAAYALLHVESEKLYVGSTEDLYKRIKQHNNRLKAGEHKNGNMQEAFNKNPNFSLAFVKTETKDQATAIEQAMLDKLMPSGRLFNISPDAYVAFKGVSMSDDQKERLRQKTNAQFSSQVSRDNHSRISKEKWRDPEYVEKFRLGCEKIDKELLSSRLSDSIKSKWLDPEFKAKMEADRQKRRKPVVIDGTEYSCVAEASEAIGVKKATIANRVKNTSDKFSNYSYVLKKEQCNG